MKNYAKFLLPIVTALTLAACAEQVVKPVDYAESRLVPEDASPAPVKFSKLRFLLPPGTEIGLESGLGLGLGNICSWSNYPVSRRVLKDLTEAEYVQDTFATALEANGYDVVESLDIDFRPEDELQRAEYFISARVKDIDLDVCHRGTDAVSAFFGGKPGIKGRFYMLVDWSVYDALRRTVVFETSTEGYIKRAYPNIEGMELLFYDAFDMAAHNLAADEDFYNLIVKGQKPPEGWRDKDFYLPRKHNEPRLFDPREALDLQNPPLSRQPLPKHIEDARNATVMIQKVGHGSGILISEQGHILTAQEVVGDATRMRVVTKGKKHKLVAEVLRVDKVRNVALLKLTEIPAGLDIKPLPIRTEKLTVSEDVYALGTPVDYRTLQDTVSKGIVSAHRLYKNEGIRLPFIQADVDTHGGNQGGPLLDEYGNLAGLAVDGRSVPGTQISSGLNFFIPISDALAALDITLSGEGVPPTQTVPGEKEEDSADEAYEAPLDLTGEEN